MSANETNRLFNIYGFTGGSFAGNVYGTDGLAPTLKPGGGGRKEPLIITDMETRQPTLPPELEGKDFRIRKLTPRECFRLMDVDDQDIDKIQATGLSNSAQYKLAGNSIVVNVLTHLFRKMFIETGPEPDGGGQQPLLF